VQFTVDNFKSGGGLLAELRWRLREILLEELNVNVERTQWIADLMGQAGKQAREQ
jgi:hypothetical protein